MYKSYTTNITLFLNSIIFITLNTHENIIDDKLEDIVKIKLEGTLQIC
jgi:hypothetical protein